MTTVFFFLLMQEELNMNTVIHITFSRNFISDTDIHIDPARIDYE